MFNLASWQLYIQVLNLQASQIIAFVLPFGLIVSTIVLIFIGIELKDKKNILYIVGLAALIAACSGSIGTMIGHNGAIAISNGPNRISILVAGITLLCLSLYAIYRNARNTQTNPSIAFLTPFVPLVLVLFCQWDFIPAFAAGITFGTLATWQRDGINILTRSIIDGIATVIPAVVLMMGIGMLINAVRDPHVTAAISPMLAHVIPTKPIPYILIFTVIAPLSLYRGPLSLWGMGSGLVALIQKATILSSQSIMSMLMSVGQIQGICDPTNTHNIWIATYLGTDTQILLRKTMPYAWIAVFCGLCLAVVYGYV
jgi:hypothetical protein